CCQCSCVDGPTYTCGDGEFACLDPSCLFNPELVVEFPDCAGDWLHLRDGSCTVENNNALCGYDGGDCCLCSCSGDACASSNFDCLDPSDGDGLYECQTPPPSVLPCSEQSQRTWVVEDSAQVNELATAINCSGGFFRVEWRGSIIVQHPFYVVDGTTVTITGADSDAKIDGNAATRLFTVINATLHLKSVNVSSGTSVTGGAIAAARASLVFNQTNFFGNRAAGNGGAVFVSDSSSVSCIGDGIFADNIAGFGGGAMFVGGGSVVSCRALWANNTAGAGGGALGVHDTSRVSWSDESMFILNSAGTYGGALLASSGTSVSWNGPTTFHSNSAGISGGAVNIVDGSILSWDATTEFHSNSAGISGGAVKAYRSNVSWSGATTYGSNFADTGGALYIEDSSAASWTAATTFRDNEARQGGGAVWVTANSVVSSNGETTTLFSGNSAGMDGGAVFLSAGSSASFDGNTSFHENSALDGSLTSDDIGGGGGLCLYGSAASWSGLTVFTRNTAGLGGALFASSGTVTWSGQTMLAGNNASSQGGALVILSSTIIWEGTTVFENNSAVNSGTGFGASGGALVAHSANVSWSGDSTEFIGNRADVYGGAIHAKSGSTVMWSGKTVFAGGSAVSGAGLFLDEATVLWSDGVTAFEGNVAFNGGAMFLRNGSYVEWTAESVFRSNQADGDGGVVGSSGLDSEFNRKEATVNINGPTTFVNNTCGANGGAMSLLGGLSVAVGEVAVSFIHNTAAVAGGAIFMSGTGVGPSFANVSFISNAAGVGGAVSTVGSGNLKNTGGIESQNPTTFDRCRFIDNRATATGGAIESAAGQDNYIDSMFMGNRAGTGGALRLAGTASLDNCSFVENVSDDAGGAAVSNIGSISTMENIYFSGNVFDCQSSTFLNFTMSGDPYETACRGCDISCDGCSFQEAFVPICSDVYEHSTSPGGDVTLETLSIERGYWRATPTSTEILACYHAGACLGGITGSSGYCLQGYEGPFCAICSDGYTAKLSFTCSRCSDSVGGVVLVVILSAVILLAAAAAVLYLMSGEVRSTGHGVVNRMARCVPLQSIKIVIVAWQILTQFASVANVTYPDLYQRFLDGLDVFNFDLGWILSAG
ncbi:unnamed protein product, partial [Hapterophycus canaliculatus]